MPTQQSNISLRFTVLFCLLLGVVDSLASSRTFSPVSDFDEMGIIHYLATSGEQVGYENPHLKGELSVTASSLGSGSRPAYAITGNEVVRCVTASASNSWFQIDFEERHIVPTHYSLRHYSSWATEALRNWVLEGSNDESTWTPLSTHVNDLALGAIGATHTWALPVTAQAFRYFRIRITGPNSNNHYYLALSGFEIYGTLESPDTPDPIDDYLFSSLFEYDSDFDQNGVVYYLATHQGISVYENPALNGFIELSSSALQNVSEPLFSIVGDQVVRCVTQADSNSWMQVDFKERRIKASHYSLRHYSSWDTEALRNWELEGSNDGLTWLTLSSHTNDASLFGIGDTQTWVIPQNSDVISYSKFRIRLTGHNSNNHYYLALSGFEIYGTMYTPSSAPPIYSNYDESSYHHSANFDGNGIIHYLATDGGMDDYVNPALKGYLSISASSMKSDSDPKEAIVGTQAVHCVTMPITNSWMSIDFKTRRVKPTHYTLRHYSSWDSEALRSWVFEASQDGSTWVVLRSHTNDTALFGKGDSETWSIPQNSTVVPYRHFRIRQTGPNSNLHHYLALSGFEVYGTLYTDYMDSYFSGSEQTYLIPFSDFDGKGLVHFLATSGETTPYINPAYRGAVTVSASSLETDSEAAEAVVGNQVVRCLTSAETNSWMAIDFKNLKIKPTHYSLRHYSSWSTETLRNWVLEASNDGTSWIVIREHTEDASLNGIGDTHTWDIPPSDYVIPYQIFRIRQTGPNSNQHDFLALSGFEIYGELNLELGSGTIIGSYPIQQHFTFSSDFDGNGIIHYMATGGYGSGIYTNPEESGWLQTTASSLAADSEPSSAIVGNQIVRCVTLSQTNAWMAVEFLNHKVTPTHYSLRHYSSWNTEELRNWVLEASNNGENWTILREHNNDTALQGIGSTHTWSLPQPASPIPYSHFRMRQTGPNSNNHNFLALSGFEVYGDLHFNYLEAPSSPISSSTNIALQPANTELDIIYELGTGSGTKVYKNPAENGLVHLSASSVMHDSETPSSILSGTLLRFVTEAQPQSWVVLDFRGRKVRPEHYSLQHYSSWDAEALRNWILEGSNDGITWDRLREHVNDNALQARGQWNTWNIEGGNSFKSYSKLRIRQTGLNSNNHHYLALSGIKIYGTMETPITAPLISSKATPIDFAPDTDFDENGIVYYLATSGGEFKYENPDEAGILATEASSLSADSEPASAIVGTQTVRCVTLSASNSWMKVDFNTYEIKPTHYSLRHYSSWDTEALRNWTLEASRDSVLWHPLSLHTNDTALNSIGATHTWALPAGGSDEWYTQFRVRQTGPNSNNHHYLALSGFELYGSLRVKPDRLSITLAPPEAISAGARWSIDEGATWNESGSTSAVFKTSGQTATVSSVIGYWSPQAKNISIQSNQFSQQTFNYTPMDNLSDADSDGIPDLWESEHNLNPTNLLDAALDHDSDGRSTLFEYHSGTDINDPASRMIIRLQINGEQSSLHINPAIDMDPFVTETSSDLKTWGILNATSNNVLNQDRILLDQDLLQNQRFYRVRLK